MSRTSARARLGALLLAATTASSVGVVASTHPASAATATTTVLSRASLDDAGKQSNGDVGSLVLTDPTGRYVYFSTTGSLVAADTNGVRDVYKHDRLSGLNMLLTVTSAGKVLDKDSDLCGASHDGRFVAFTSKSAKLPGSSTVAGTFLRDVSSGTTERISVSSNEVVGDAGGTPPSGRCDVSDDGRYVVFGSYSTNLVPNDTNASQDVFLRDRTLGTTQRVSIDGAGNQANGGSSSPVISGDGTVVAFDSQATNLVANDTNGQSDVFIHTGAGQTARVSVLGAGTQLTGGGSIRPAVSGDGTKVAFETEASNAYAGKQGTLADIMLRDRSASVTKLISATSDDDPADGDSREASISNDGTRVGYHSEADNLVFFQTGTYQAYVKNVGTKANSLVSGNAQAVAGGGYSYTPAISDDGTVAAFSSSADDLVRKDTNGTRDAFVNDTDTVITPFADWESFVKQQYQDFEGRQPTTNELNVGMARLSYGEVSWEQFVDELAHGTTFAGRRAPVIRLYWAFFERIPDVDGLNYWTGRLAAGKSLSWIASQFAGSSEFKSTYGTVGNQDFVKLVYVNVFDRQPDASGLAYWTQQLDIHAVTRGDVMTGFSQSAEGKRRLSPQVDTVLFHLGMIRKMPAPNAFSQYVSILQSNPPELEVALLRKTSAYTGRFA